ncbi:hypothetical protein M2310_007405, partial [Rhizobium leguminosarum]|nr:hypothetical protein [Rhizobium leguminosarum]
VVFVRHGTRIKLIAILFAYRRTVQKLFMHQSLEESNDIVPAKPAAAHDRASTIDSVNLKYLLSDIQTNCGNLLHGRLS